MNPESFSEFHFVFLSSGTERCDGREQKIFSPETRIAPYQHRDECCSLSHTQTSLLSGEPAQHADDTHNFSGILSVNAADIQK